MKIVCISDTHQRHKQLTIPEGDILIHAGDFTNMGRTKEIKKFNGWLGQLPHKHKIIIAGNHDLKFQNDRIAAERMITNAVYLRDESVTIDGIKIYGSPWSTPFFPQHWVFNAERGDELAHIWANIPDDTDILITHGPPFGYGDRVARMGVLRGSGDMHELNKDFAWTHNGRVGCEDLAARVRVVKPRLHLFGHIHEDRGEWKDEHTTYANVANWDHNTDHMRDPVVFEWDYDV